MISKRIYLDYAAATPVADQVAEAMNKVRVNFANPSAQYKSAKESQLILEKARKDCAMFLQANSQEIIFTSGSTESNNLAVLGIARACGGGRIIAIATEHASVAEPLNRLVQEGFDVVFCPVDSKGKIILSELEKLLTKNTILVTVAYASGEVGTIQPIGEIGQIIKKYNTRFDTKVRLHTDASASVLTLPCDVARLGVDAVTIGGAKIYGPHGVGLLYLKRGIKIEPLQYGGNQQNSIRPGTETVTLAVGLAKALALIAKNRKTDYKKFIELHAILLDKLDSKRIHYTYNGHLKERLYQLVNISIANQNGEDMVAKLDAKGLEVATGATCEANNEKPNRVLLAIGLSVKQAQSSLRISYGRDTTTDDIATLAQSIFDII